MAKGFTYEYPQFLKSKLSVGSFSLENHYSIITDPGRICPRLVSEFLDTSHQGLGVGIGGSVWSFPW